MAGRGQLAMDQHPFQGRAPEEHQYLWPSMGHYDVNIDFVFLQHLVPDISFNQRGIQLHQVYKEQILCDHKKFPVVTNDCPVVSSLRYIVSSGYLQFQMVTLQSFFQEIGRALEIQFLCTFTQIMPFSSLKVTFPLPEPVDLRNKLKLQYQLKDFEGCGC